MAIKPTKRKGSPYWYARGTHKGIQVFESTGILHADAKRAPRIVEDYIAKLQNEIEDTAIHGKAHKATFADAAQNYLSQGGSPRFLEKVVMHIGHVKLKDIDQEFVNQASIEMYGHCTNSTRNRQFFTPFISVWNANTAGQNPLCRAVNWKRPSMRADNKAKKIASIGKAVKYEDAWTFINAASKPLAEILFFMFYTGCRPIEAILLDERYVFLENRWGIFNDTKTEESRSFPIHECLIPMLERLCQKEGRVFHNSRGVPWPDNRLYSKSGRILSQRGGQFQTPIRSAQKKTGLMIEPYHARHTVATHLVYPGGVHEVIKNEILGHGNKGRVSSDYLHLPRQAHIDAINILPKPVGLRKDLL